LVAEERSELDHIEQILASRFITGCEPGRWFKCNFELRLPGRTRLSIRYSRGGEDIDSSLSF
jgi:hypothetical protein